MSMGTSETEYLPAAEHIAALNERDSGAHVQFQRGILFTLIDIAYTLRDIRSELRARPIG
jgi:hypothetical protein